MGLEPICYKATNFKSVVSSIPPNGHKNEGSRDWTCDFWYDKPTLYHWVIPPLTKCIYILVTQKVVAIATFSRQL